MKSNPKTSRRQWLSGLLRGGVLAAFGGASWHLLNRNGRDETECVDPKGYIGCPSCGVLNGCRLPRALSFKNYLQTHEHNEQQSS